MSHCPFSDIDVLVACPAGGPCCQEDHHHGEAASSCSAEHEGASCPSPDRCKVWEGMTANLRHPEVNEDPGPCPGGHCGLGVEGCGVCRPLTITVVPGSTQVLPVAGLGA